MPLPELRRQKFFTPSASAAFFARFDRIEPIDHSPQALPAAENRPGLPWRLAERLDSHAVGPGEPDESECRGQLLGVV